MPLSAIVMESACEHCISSSFSGAIFIDKPSGITSAEVLRVLKRQYGIKKLGHAGTLDPLATGLLIVLCGKASRLQDMFLNSDKEYEATILVGQGTDTNDIDGQITHLEAVNLETDFGGIAQVEKKLSQEFIGEISQIPPQFAAIKQNGRPIYERARRGEVVEVEPRSICIRSSLFKVVTNDSIFCRIACSKGTYIRSIARDAGTLLGTAACIATLRRVRSGEFSVDNAARMEDLNAGLLPVSAVASIEQLADLFPRVEVCEADAKKLQGGIQQPLERVATSGASQEKPFASLWSEAGELIGFLELGDFDTKPSWKIRFIL